MIYVATLYISLLLNSVVLTELGCNKKQIVRLATGAVGVRDPPNAGIRAY